MVKVEYTENGMIIAGEFISWDIINLEKIKIKYPNHVLVKTETRYGRDSLVCDFVIEKTEWEHLKENLEKYNIKRVCMGEVCGKHSEVMFYPYEDIKEEISDINQIAKFIEGNGLYYSNYEGNPYWSLFDAITEESESQTNQ